MKDAVYFALAVTVMLAVGVLIAGVVGVFAPEQAAPPLVYPNGPTPLSVEEFTKLQEDLRKQGHGKKVGVTVLDFYADWCQPCRAAKRTVKRLIDEGYDVREIDIDTAAGSSLKQSHGVKAVPTFIVHVDGKETLRTHDVEQLAKHLAPYKPPR